MTKGSFQFSTLAIQILSIVNNFLEFFFITSREINSGGIMPTHLIKDNCLMALEIGIVNLSKASNLTIPSSTCRYEIKSKQAKNTAEY